ncbi:MAG TPA: hypothetical protein PKD00_01950 [Burkholderiales bacterium]|nr:hypothetical protein [Burkholderiales bacterium]
MDLKHRKEKFKYKLTRYVDIKDVSYKKAELYKKIAKDKNIRNSSNKVDWRLVHDVILFYEKFIVSYCEKVHTDKLLMTPFGTFRPSFKKMETLASILSERHLNAANKYVDWYNMIYDNMLNNKGIKFIRRVPLECYTQEDVKHSFFQPRRKSSVKLPKEPTPDFLNKVVIVVTPEYLSKEGIVLKQTATYVLVLLFETNKKIYLDPKYIRLK